MCVSQRNRASAQGSGRKRRKKLWGVRVIGQNQNEKEKMKKRKRSNTKRSKIKRPTRATLASFRYKRRHKFACGEAKGTRKDVLWRCLSSAKERGKRDDISPHKISWDWSGSLLGSSLNLGSAQGKRREKKWECLLVFWLHNQSSGIFPFWSVAWWAAGVFFANFHLHASVSLRKCTCVHMNTSLG